MTTIIETLAGLAENPREAAAGVISRRGPMSAGVAGYFAGALSLLIAQGMTGGGHSLPGIGFLLAAVFVMQLAGGFITAAMVHSYMDAAGYEGNATGLFILFGLSDLAWTLLVPGVMLTGILDGNGNLGLLLLAVAGGVNLYARTAAVKRAYNAGGFQALFAVCMPYALACAAAGAFFIYGLAWIVMALF